MKRFLLLVILLSIFFECFAIDYFSQGSVTPNLLANWNTLPGGGGTAPTSFTNPTSDRFIIQIGHFMTTNATWTIGSPGAILEIRNGGTLQGDHTIILTGTFQISNGGTYIHNNTGPVSQAAITCIFSGAEAFQPTSNFEIRNWVDNITGLPSTMPVILWGNLIVNLQADLGGTWNWNFADGQTIGISGNLDIRATYATIPAELRLTPTGTHIINVGGGFLLSGTKTQVAIKKTDPAPLNGYTTMQVNGNVSLTGSAQLDLGFNTTSTTAVGLYELRFKGNFSAAGGTTVTSTSSTPYLVANGTIAQTLSCTPTLDCNFRVAPGAIVNLSSTLTAGTNRVMAILGTFNQNTNILTINGTLATAGGTFNAGGTFTVGISCTACSSDGTYNTTNNTWCTTAGSKGTINFTNSTISLNNNISTTLLTAGNFFINSPGDIYLVNSTATSMAAPPVPPALPAAYMVQPNSIFSLDESSYVAGSSARYQGRGGTLRIGSVNGITALPDITTGNIRAGLSRDYTLSGTNNFEYFGTNPQVTGNGLPATIAGTLTINNSAGISSLGVTLTNSTTIDGLLDMTLGKLRSSSSALISISVTGIISNYGSNSFIGGPLKVTGHDGFTFPIGINAPSAPTGTIYAPVVMNHFGGTATPTDSYTAEYFRANPQTAVGAAIEAPINHISLVEYWSYTRNDGGANTPSKQLIFEVNPESFCYNLATLLVARYDVPGSIWKSEGNAGFFQAGTALPLVWGHVNSDPTTNISGFFTLATTDPFSSNPLPITLLSFDAIKLTNTKSSLNWELAVCCSAAARFEIQRAGADKSFSKIATVNGSVTDRFYTYTDHGLKSGINYYRLKMINEDGKISYSRTIAIMNGVQGLLLTSLIPTVTTNWATLTIASSSHQKLNLVILDMQGRVMQRQSLSLTPGNTSIQLSTAGFGAGVYQLTGISAKGRTNIIRFIKQ